MDELENQIIGLDAGTLRLSQSDTVTLLSKLRKSRIIRPDIVYAYGKSLLDSNGLKSGEVWSVYEQVIMAALQMGDVSTARGYYEKLHARFNGAGADGESSRVKKIAAMISEAEGVMKGEGDTKSAGALKTYNELLEKNAANLPVLKRKAALLRATGQTAAAVDALHDVLKLYASDVQTWGELAELHLELGDLDAAAFCLEELVLLNPLCVAYHTRLAEVFFSQGSTEALTKARKHFSISLNTQSANLNKRALYGLVETCRRLQDLASWGDDGAQNKAVTERMLDWALVKLHELDGTPEIATIVAGALGK